MPVDFCEGYSASPFRELVRNYPGESVYPRAKFRSEWGPIFHRGRLDGSARVLIIGQDPAQHEGITRRILVGAAGQRVQGFLAKLGIARSYVMVNTYLFSVAPGNPGSSSINDPAITAYRNQWFDAIFDVSGTPRKLEAVVAFGGLAKKAWEKWANAQPAARTAGLAVAFLTHPTASAHFGDEDTPAAAAKIKQMLDQWDDGLDLLRPEITHPDISPKPTSRYSTKFRASDYSVIPAIDLPAGLPRWMRESTEPWAVRQTRPKILVTIPPGSMAGPFGVPAELQAEDRVEPQAVAHAGAFTIEAMGISAQAARPAARRAGLSAIRGTVVTMKPGAQPLTNHTIYIRDGLIAAIQPTPQPAPAGFAGVSARAAEGFIFPGFMELHNHLPYNVLPIWNVPQTFKHRGQWRDHKDYRQLITGPMKTIASTEPLVAAVCRYVECKALFGGTTTSQGVTLSSAGTARRHLKGLLRNCESTDDPDLNPAGHTIADFNANTVEGFYKQLKNEDSCYLMHLAEGIPGAARKHFAGLKRTGKTPRYAITGNMCGIHSTGLEAADFKIMAELGGSIVWSPLSNLLLYGETTNIKAALEAGVTIGIGADWSPSGSKSILGEFKVARAWCDFKEIDLSDQEIIAMATRNASRILKWMAKPDQAGAGTLEAGNIADITIIKGTGTDPYKAVLKAHETDVRLVMIGGEARFGVKELVRHFTDSDDGIEMVKIGGKPRALNLHPANKLANPESPELDDLSLAEATERLKIAFANLPELHEAAPAMAAIASAAGPDARPRWTLALDEIQETGYEQRPLKGLPGTNTKSLTKLSPSAASAQDVELKPIRLDPLTVVDDDQFIKSLGKAKNLPAPMKTELLRMLNV